MTRVQAMIASQRSGTHMLKDAFNSHPDVRCLSEPFYHTDRTAATLDRVLTRAQQCREAVVVLDIKYNQVSPAIERWLKNAPVFHLCRQDVRRVWFSGQLRHYLHHEATPAEARAYRECGVVPKIAFDAQEFRGWSREMLALRERLAPLASLTLTYEELTGNREIHEIEEGYGRHLCAWLRVPYAPLVTRLTKDAPSEIEGYWKT